MYIHICNSSTDTGIWLSCARRAGGPLVLAMSAKQNTPPENNSLRKMSHSGAGEQFLLKGCRAKAHLKG